MSDLSQRLRSQGLEKLEQTLTKNDVTLDILEELTDADLVSLGLSLGDRKRLLKAIRRPSSTANSLPSRVEAPELAAPMPTDDGIAERRHLTVMFCDLVGSTRLAEELDPEDAGKVLKAYHRQAQAAVETFGGRIAQFLGDGVLAYFGYPSAHEDDAERAARAALDLLRRLAAAPASGDVALQARVGIAAGPVVMNEMMQIAGWNSDSAVGRTINLAARLQAEADPGCIVVDDSVQRSLGAAFVMRPLGKRSLKGITNLVELWQLEDGGRAGGSRFDATRHRDHGPMVGRAEELAILHRKWKQAIEGRGSAIVLTADAGLGKSRLLHELRSSIDSHLEIVAQCVSYSSATPYLPLTEALRRLTGFDEHDDADARRAKLDAVTARHGFDDSRLTGGLRYLLGVAGEDDDIVKVSAEVRQARTFESLRALFFALSRSAPLLLVVEDMHWSDRATEALLTTLVDELGESRILFVSTHRPEHRIPWLGRSGVVQLPLSLLNREESRALLVRLLGDRADDETYCQAVAARAQGNPLFLEELSFAVGPALAEKICRNRCNRSSWPASMPCPRRSSAPCRPHRYSAANSGARCSRRSGSKRIAWASSSSRWSSSS